MKTAALIVGARPQFIKTAPLVIELGRFYRIVLIHTGQHYDFSMSDTFFEELNLPSPDYHLNINSGTRGRQTGEMMKGIYSLLDFEKPDFSIVIGDTNSTLAGAIAAAQLAIPIVHVEAGVRSKNPILPEQINRIVTDSVSNCFLCPTVKAVENLKKEGKSSGIFDTGDIIYDCLRLFEDKIPNRPSIEVEIPSKFVLATLHRAEAVDDRENLSMILSSLGKLTLPVILPLHPRTRKMIDRFDLGDMIGRNITVIDPVGYLDILSLMKASEFVVSDSGGIQREAVYFGKRTIVPRPETEWRELEARGWVKVAGYDFDSSDFGGMKSPELPEDLMRPASGSMLDAIKQMY